MVSLSFTNSPACRTLHVAANLYRLMSYCASAQIADYIQSEIDLDRQIALRFALLISGRFRAGEYPMQDEEAQIQGCTVSVSPAAYTLILWKEKRSPCGHYGNGMVVNMLDDEEVAEMRKACTLVTKKE
ncbi:MAG TPA: hypothetical protein PKH77_25000 [Anaerolineae bacterium]|nr:hypothetical protein [Anaerolineae bacterium]